jgi:hypothetical protein
MRRRRREEMRGHWSPGGTTASLSPSARPELTVARPLTQRTTGSDHAATIRAEAGCPAPRPGLEGTARPVAGPPGPGARSPRRVSPLPAAEAEPQRLGRPRALLAWLRRCSSAVGSKPRVQRRQARSARPDLPPPPARARGSRRQPGPILTSSRLRSSEISRTIA